MNKKNEQRVKDKLYLHFTMSANDWLDAYGTGHLCDLKDQGAKWHPQYLIERVAMDYGYEFLVVPKKNLRIGPALSMGDSSAHTALARHAARLNLRDIFGDTYKPVHLELKASGKGEDGPPKDALGEKQGIGILVEHNKKPFWVPEDCVVVALTAEYDTDQHKFLEPKNPG